MKKLKNIVIVICLLLIICISAYHNNIKGDVNLDGELNVLDMICTCNYINSDNGYSLVQIYNMDINRDNKINNLDLDMMKNIIINEE